MIGMLLELVNLGPLDKYLCSNSKSVLTVDMVEATVCLATALWHLVNFSKYLCYILMLMS